MGKPDYQYRIGGDEFLDTSVLDGVYVPPHKRSISEYVRDVIPQVRDAFPPKKVGRVLLVAGLMTLGYLYLAPKDEKLKPYVAPDGDIFSQELKG